jgi:hypothetical protein
MKSMRIVVSDTGSQGNSAIFVEAEANSQRPASSSRKVGGWGRTWIIELISLLFIVLLSAASAGSLLVQAEDGEREGGDGGGGILWK